MTQDRVIGVLIIGTAALLAWVASRRKPTPPVAQPPQQKQLVLEAGYALQNGGAAGYGQDTAPNDPDTGPSGLIGQILTDVLAYPWRVAESSWTGKEPWSVDIDTSIPESPEAAEAAGYKKVVREDGTVTYVLYQ